jgi:ABC-type multidrug transport system fused ATPase/permease subunit
MARYCIGPGMATDWDDDGSVCIDRRLAARAFGYFLPYRRRGALSLATIAAGAVLGLAPAWIAKRLIDGLSAGDTPFSHVALLVGAGLGAAILNGIVNVGGSYLSTSISQGSWPTCAGSSSSGCSATPSASSPAAAPAT